MLTPFSPQFAYNGNDIAAEIGGGAVGVSYLRSLSIDEPFIRQVGIGNEYYHTDVLGSSLALSDASGGSVTTYGYESFGRTQPMNPAFTNPFQFTGRENDGTGLYYYRARYYNPGLQRLISEDPMGFAGGDLNLYAYVMNNPTRFVNPLGLDWFRPPSDDYIVGRDDTLVRPGKDIGWFLED